MRIIVVLLALLAGAKIAAQQILYRAASEEAVVAAYADRAIEACRAGATAQGLPGASLVTNRNADIAFVVGNTEMDVPFWETHNSLWAARYRTPFLHIRLASGANTLTCAYDITHKVASISR